MRSLSVVSGGYLGNGKSSLSIATEGYLSNFTLPIEPIKRFTYSGSIYEEKKELKPNRLKIEDEEILKIIEFISSRIL